MSLTEALVLGVLQGLTEFLPISSSGHLALAQHLLGMKGLERNIAFTVMLHVASLAAVLWHYRRAIPALFGVGRRELAYLAVATVPIGVAGLTLRSPLEAAHGVPLLVCVCFVLNGIFLLVADAFGRGQQPVAGAPPWKIVLVGVVQAVRLPGLSRSGGTIGTAWLCGIERRDAVRFSFLLSVPAILGVAAVKARRLLDGGVDLPLVPVLLAASVTFVLSLVSIRVVERLSMRRGFLVFAVYGVVAGIAAGAWLLARS